MGILDDMGMYIIYSLIIYAFFVLGRQYRDVYRSTIVAFIIGNVINLEFVLINFSTQFVAILIFELVNLFLSYILSKLIEAIANMGNKVVLFIFEIGISFGLCYLFYFANSLLLTLI